MYRYPLLPCCNQLLSTREWRANSVEFFPFGLELPLYHLLDSLLLNVSSLLIPWRIDSRFTRRLFGRRAYSFGSIVTVAIHVSLSTVGQRL